MKYSKWCKCSVAVFLLLLFAPIPMPFLGLIPVASLYWQTILTPQWLYYENIIDWSGIILLLIVFTVHILVSVSAGLALARWKRYVVGAILFVSLLIAFLVFQQYNVRDATYESSDGHWSSNTLKSFGIDFREVLYNFEAYRFTSGNDNARLVRVTRRPMFRWLWSRNERLDPMWNVPYQRAVGASRHEPKDLAEDKRDEIGKRADVAFDYWLGIK